MEVINVSGGYWTGSSAIIALLEEFEDISACSIEFSAFGYGELFSHLINQDKDKIENSKRIFEQYNKAEKFKLFKSVLRVLCRKLKIFPKNLFYPNLNGANLFGSNYNTFCESEYNGLFSSDVKIQKETLNLFLIF